jgi:hypothetical protein
VIRQLIFEFSCALFGHQLDVQRPDQDARSCECGRRVVPNAVLVIAQYDLRKHNWRP